MQRRVAITGIGLVTALGATREASWRQLTEGTCGIRPVTAIDPEGYRSRIAGEAPMAEIDAPLTPHDRRRWSRSDRIGLHAALEAVDDAGLASAEGRGRGPVASERIGVFLGAGTADLLRNEEFYRTWKSEGIERTRRSDVWNHFSSTTVDLIAERFGFEGPRGCIVAACSSSTIAIGRAADAIRQGRATVALAGGTDALSRLTFSGFNQLKLMDQVPCRPFDRTRAGMNIGEGAGILVLEDLDHARRRGVHVYAELAGYALGCEAHHPTAPEPDGKRVASLIVAALDDARANPADVDHVNAHGTATPQNDAAEARAFHRALGDRGTRIPVTSLKSMVGHCLGAAGAVEAAVLALTVERSIIPPTIHHSETDPDCGVDIVANVARDQRVQCGISTSLAFGGNDSVIVMRALET